MTDREFRPHAEAWLAAYQRAFALHLDRLITAGSQKMPLIIQLKLGEYGVSVLDWIR